MPGAIGFSADSLVEINVMYGTRLDKVKYF